MYKESSATEIVPNLWLGNYLSSQDHEFLQKHNIRRIVNATPDFPNIFENIKYIRVSIKNRIQYVPLLKQELIKINSFIKEGLEKNKGVLVHCKEGHRRSATIIASFLNQYLGVIPEQAKSIVLQRRPSTFPSGTVIARALENL